MMSASDMPAGMAQAGAGAAVDAATDTVKGDDSNMKQIWKFIYVDMSFIKSLYGILYAAELVSTVCSIVEIS